jgi:predicted CXXCH cytochrome family protein
VTVSQRPPATATFVGSSTCLGCHGGTHSGWKRSLHSLVYRKPGAPTANQDLSQLPKADAPLALFQDGNASDNTGASDELGLRISKTDAASTYSGWSTAYNVLLGKDATGYFFQTETPDKAMKSMRYYVAFTFGGHGLYKQRYVTRVKADKSYQACATTPCTDWSYFVSPIQFDERLQPGAQPLHPYNGGNWGAPAVDGGTALLASKDKSFDLNCAGCHFTGNRVAVDASGNFQADAVDDANGPIDYDGDGTKDEISVGCEACHGAGSAHASAPGRGKNIITPAFLSAERENQLCGNCHTRGVGKGTVAGAHTEYPSKGADGAIAFAYPGMSRTEFLADYHTDGLGTWPDADKHARQHHQQANDMLRSTHFKNPYDLVSCSTCHDVHDRQNGPSLAARVDDNALCLGCHAPYGFGLQPGWTKDAEALAVSSHVAENAYMLSGYDPLNLAGIGALDASFSTAIGGVGRCTTCHMTKTAASQSRFVHEEVSTGLQPSGARIRGDISSHQFDVVWPAQSESVLRNNATNNQMSNGCGACHNALAGVAPNYAY